jgi:hypothetical protein
MRRMLAGAIAVLVGAIAATGAAATPTLEGRTSSPTIHGPRLAGESVFFGEVGTKRLVMRLLTPTERIKLASLGLPPSPPSEEEESPGDFVSFSSNIAASPQRLVYKEAISQGNARYQVGSTSVKLFGGAATGRDFGTIDSCTNDGLYGPGSAGLDVDGTRAVSTDCGGQAVIRDYSGPAPTSTSVSAGQGLQIAEVALAGRYLAYNAFSIGPSVSPTVTVVHDWVANQKLYEVPRAPAFDLQDDGTLVTSTGRVDDLTCDDGKLAWHSIADPAEHVLPVKPCSSRVRIAGGRVAVITEDVPNGRRKLTLAGLDGSRADVVRLGADSVQRGSHDFDGTRVAYAISNCVGGADLLTESATAVDDHPAGPVSCPTGKLSGSDQVGPKEKSAFVNVTCPRACLARVLIRAMYDDDRIRTIGTSLVRIEPGAKCGGAVTRVPLTAAGLKELRRRGSLRAALRVENRDRAGGMNVKSRGFRLRAGRTNGAVPQPAC